MRYARNLRPQPIANMVVQSQYGAKQCDAKK
jgi:hypothetical protein